MQPDRSDVVVTFEIVPRAIPEQEGGGSIQPPFQVQPSATTNSRQLAQDRKISKLKSDCDPARGVKLYSVVNDLSPSWNMFGGLPRSRTRRPVRFRSPQSSSSAKLSTDRNQGSRLRLRDLLISRSSMSSKAGNARNMSPIARGIGLT